MTGVFQKQWDFLRKSALLEKLSHAYLFSNGLSQDKENFAREFAKFVNCKAAERKEKACGACLSCKEFEKNCHPDFLWQELPEKEESQIDAIRDLKNWLSLKPVLGAFKIAIINRAESFSFAAQSALLKTLEEPQGNSLIVLISGHSDLLLETIFSRVQEIKFSPRPATNVKKEELRILEEIMQAGIAPCFQKIKEAVENEPLEFLEKLITVSRSAFLAKTGVLKDSTGEEKSFSQTQLARFLASALKTYYLITRTNTNKRFALENLILELF